MFQVGFIYYLGLNFGRSVSVKRQENEEPFFQKHSWRVHVSPMFPSLPYRKHCFQCQFFFQDANYASAVESCNQNPIMRPVAKFCEHEQASTHFLRAIRAKAKFCEHFQIEWDHSIPLWRTCAGERFVKYVCLVLLLRTVHEVSLSK